ncbi:CoA transferase [Amaricoccus sp. W119]|uniref:CoA transferase n=1 Tax=Amaricoccus sp. W119 TaxID=3391833 RepID=UPI0039A4E254
MYRILSDLTVVEGASFIAGPSCSLHLHQFGARVIKFDMIGGGPDQRRWPISHAGGSYYWESLNQGKLSIAVDLRSEEGRELATEIITMPGPGRGLFVTNYPEGGFLAHERLAALRPDLITLRVMGWPDGRSGVDYTVNAAVGVPFMTGDPDANSTRPVNSSLPAWDLLTGAYGAFALLAAERRRSATGQGGEVCLSLSDIAIGSLANLGQIAEVLAHGDRGKMGNDLYGAFGRDFLTADGRRIMIVAITPRQWSGLVRALDIREEIESVEARLGISFARDEGVRFTHRREIFPVIERAVLARPFAEIAESLDREPGCWEPYRTLREAVEGDPRLVRDNPMFTETPQPTGLYPVPAAMARISGTETHAPVPAPRLGAHTEEVLSVDLGLAQARIGDLLERRVIAV